MKALDVNRKSSKKTLLFVNLPSCLLADARFYILSLNANIRAAWGYQSRSKHRA